MCVGGGGAELYTRPYPLKVKARLPRHQRLVPSLGSRGGPIKVIKLRCFIPNACRGLDPRQGQQKRSGVGDRLTRGRPHTDHSGGSGGE